MSWSFQRNKIWLRLQWHIVALWCHVPSKDLAIIGSCNGLLPDGNKPLHKAMLMYYQWGPLAITWARFLSLSQNVLSNCLSQDRSETVLRFYIQITHFYIAKLLPCNWTLDSLLFVWYRTANLMFLNCAWRHLWYVVDTTPIVSERAQTEPSHRVC